MTRRNGSDGPDSLELLTVLATQAQEKVIAYRRGSVKAIRAYLEAGALLAQAHEACTKRGEWKEVCSVTGVSPTASRSMRQLAAAELSPESIHAQGGIQASLDGLRKRTAPPAAPPPGLTNQDRVPARRPDQHHHPRWRLRPRQQRFPLSE